MAIPLFGRLDRVDVPVAEAASNEPPLESAATTDDYTAGPVADAEARFRTNAERLAVRLRWLSLIAIPVLAVLSPHPVSWPPFLTVIAIAVAYNAGIALWFAQNRDASLLSFVTAIVDGMILGSMSFWSGGLDSIFTTFMCLAMVSVSMRLPLPWVIGMACVYAVELAAFAALEGRLGSGLLPVRILYVFLTVAFVTPLVHEARLRFAEALAGHTAQRSLLHRLLRSTEEERRRIAGDLHDRGGGALFTLLHGLRRIRELNQPQDAATAVEVDRLIGLTESTVADLRIFLADLRPQLLDDLGLAEALRDLLTRERALARIRLSLEVDPEARPDPESALALYRVAQESLTNVRRHAHARSAAVHLIATRRGWQLSVEDDGLGFAGEGAGLGLRTMRERVEALGGNLRVGSARGRGTRITASVPLRTT